MRIGFVGHPPDLLIEKYSTAGILIDLDAGVDGIPLSLAEAYVPKTFCAILRTVLVNALTLELDLIIASTGKCKCDGMRYLASILREAVSCPVIGCENDSSARQGNPISTSSLPLKKKMELIVSGIASREKIQPEQCEPVMGFWGVPPYDFSLLDLFPAKTHIYGWSRCLENRTPADLELELLTDDIPTVFFSQSFCQKNSIAQYLAKKQNGLYLETDERVTHSARTKLEAFIELKVNAAGEGAGRKNFL